ncbi:30S ribosomal protein S16 [Blastococcus sp. Marseille-P5729]|uniref:30S ribosomal protein S16 n=1 Tax=Blastococcus sp. Marseille-P5729 TaxID=2086582 RepID=UPI000D106DA4|nr:30S ribosomal protein S16 [Blastococcus sp. Marseille-P5729]
MATKIKLMRLGKTRAPYYRIVVADARTKRDGRSIETIGKYHPKEEPSFIEVDSERAQYWLGVGAQPTEAVTAILKVTGDWQRFKGEPAPEPMKTKSAAEDKKARYEAALSGAMADAEAGKGQATTPKKKAAPKADEAAEPKADEPKVDEAKAEEPKTEAPADEAKAEEAPAEEAK